jgi:CRP-like cAMP-binding protein
VCFSTLCTVGYGDITPQTTGEILFAICVMLVGATLFSYCTAAISSLFAEADADSQLFRKRMQTLQTFIQNESLPKELRQKLTRRMKGVWKPQSHRSAEWHSMFSEMPRDLAYLVVDSIFKHLIAASPIMDHLLHKGKGKNLDVFLNEVLLHCKFSGTTRGSYLVQEGDKTRKMYILESGIMMAEKNHVDEPISVRITPGHIIGYDHLFPKHHTWSFDLVSYTNCRIMSVSTNKFMRLAKEYGVVEELSKLTNIQDSALKVIDDNLRKIPEDFLTAAAAAERIASAEEKKDEDLLLLSSGQKTPVSGASPSGDFIGTNKQILKLLKILADRMDDLDAKLEKLTGEA